jgi:two-component system, OmpR family, phosphate regulon sensor histidine kinase PhoR
MNKTFAPDKSPVHRESTRHKSRPGRYKKIVRDLPLGVVELDYSGRCLFINNSARVFLGVGNGRVKSRKLIDLLDDQELSRSLGQIIAAARDGAKTPRTISRDGQALEIKPIDPTGCDNFSGMVLTIDEISPKKTVSEDKEDFLALVSHELRTPLTIIKGYLDIFSTGLMGDLSDSQIRSTRLMLEHCDQLEQLITNLIHYRDLVLKPNTYHPQTVVLKPLLDRLQSELAGRVHAAGMTMSLKLEHEDLLCRCDHVFLFDIIEQLIDNAVKHARSGGSVRVTVSKFRSGGPLPPGHRVALNGPVSADSCICIRVIDKGPGIPADRMAGLCDAFRQGERYLTRTINGMGIGLAIVKRKVELSGGKMWISSGPGTGTEISVLLPQPANRKTGRRD